jgi:hypothetical protein
MSSRIKGEVWRVMQIRECDLAKRQANCVRRIQAALGHV